MGIPAFFESLLAEQYTPDDVSRILKGCHIERAVTLRANALKSNRQEVAAALDEAALAWEGAGWYPDAFVLASARERDIRALPAYEQGRLYIQSLSSMIPALVLDARPGEDVCDMCAAPGGKTTQIAALTGGKAHITACELHAPRAERLAFNLERQGARAVTVMRTDARRLDDLFSFDRILLDAPCSGSGTLNADDPKTVRHFTPELVAKSRKAQTALFAKALALLKPRGTLVYSTCSVLACENEDIVAQGLARPPRGRAFELEPVKLAEGDDLPRLPVRLDGALCLAPTERYEGFFVAKTRRTR